MKENVHGSHQLLFSQVNVQANVDIDMYDPDDDIDDKITVRSCVTNSV